jgi:hypothetical protein
VIATARLHGRPFVYRSGDMASLLHARVICCDARSVKERDLFADDDLAEGVSYQPRPAGA